MNSAYLPLVSTFQTSSSLSCLKMRTSTGLSGRIFFFDISAFTLLESLGVSASEATSMAMQPASRLPATAAAAPASKKEAKAPAIFKALAERLAKTPNLAKEVGAVVQFVVTGPDASYVGDFTGAGAIKEGTDAKAAVTLRLSDDDLEALAKGEALRDLYQHGRVRIDGDARVAHKLNFFKGLV